MYRIQLASLEEAAFRSLDEFAVAVQYGIVNSDALIFHAKAKAWLPIESHPHYRLAQTMATSMPVPSPTPDLEPSAKQAVPPTPKRRPQSSQRKRVVRKLENASHRDPVPRPPDVPEPVVIQVSASVSKTRRDREPKPIPKRELDPKPRPKRDLDPKPRRESRPRSKPVNTTTATTTVPSNSKAHSPETDNGLLRSGWQSSQPSDTDQPGLTNEQKYGYAIDGLERHPLGPHHPVQKRSKRSLVMAIVVGTVVILGRWSTLPEGPVAMTSGVTAGLEPPPSQLPATEPDRPSDRVTAGAASPTGSTPRETYRSAYGQALADYKSTLNSLEFGSLFVAHRLSTVDSLRVVRRLVQTAQNVVGVYRDLEVRIDQQFDSPTPSLREPYKTAVMADSLFSTIDSLFGLLLTNAGQYRLRAGRVEFESRTAAANYEELASWLRARSEWYRNRPEGMPLTIAPIVLATSAPPPPRLGRGP